MAFKRKDGIQMWFEILIVGVVLLMLAIGVGSDDDDFGTPLGCGSNARP